jgi:predicted CoA-binding protein
MESQLFELLFKFDLKMKPTLVIGASLNPDRYAHKAVVALQSHDLKVIAYGLRHGTIKDTVINTKWNPQWKVDTVTLYINAARQGAFIDSIISLKPRRVIFNPGTENVIFYQKLTEARIPYMEACTLVLLATGQY